MSKRDREGVPIATPDWIFKPVKIKNKRMDADDALRRFALDGIGDPERERCFRMQVTLCIHRGATEAEVAGLPESWHEALSGMAGGPVQVIYERGVKALPSAMPCADPIREDLGYGRPNLWIPKDCGRCESCLARKAIERNL